MSILRPTALHGRAVVIVRDREWTDRATNGIRIRGARASTISVQGERHIRKMDRVQTRQLPINRALVPYSKEALERTSLSFSFSLSGK